MEKLLPSLWMKMLRNGRVHNFFLNVKANKIKVSMVLIPIKSVINITTANSGFKVLLFQSTQINGREKDSTWNPWPLVMLFYQHLGFAVKDNHFVFYGKYAMK